MNNGERVDLLYHNMKKYEWSGRLIIWIFRGLENEPFSFSSQPAFRLVNSANDTSLVQAAQKPEPGQCLVDEARPDLGMILKANPAQPSHMRPL